jgi:hypothetical protein
MGVIGSGRTQSMAPQSPLVVELFTSQGCSSCPPADALLGELARLPNVVALGFHVDYWDSIGWRDRYSLPVATTRQTRYVDTLELPSAFTPQVVIDGRSSVVGSDRQRILSMLGQNRTAISIPIAVSVSAHEVAVTLTERKVSTVYEVNLAAFLAEATTAIGRGENSGRRLTEFNIVRQFRSLGTWHGEGKTFRVPVDALPADATRVAVLLQRAGQGAIAGSVVASLR